MFFEGPGLILQIREKKFVLEILDKSDITYQEIGKVQNKRLFQVMDIQFEKVFDIDRLRDLWFKTSYLLDRKQSGPELAKARFDNYKKQPLIYRFPSGFSGKGYQYGLKFERQEKTGIKAAIIREKGVNGDREMAFVLHLAGFDVKDVHMTDLIAGRENLEDISLIVYVGGFSNSDVLGSAKGWAGAFLYNPKAKQALDNFYQRKDTLSLGVCNGCQLMVELGLIYPDKAVKPRMRHNLSNKFESAFVNVEIPENQSVMLKSLAGSRLGIWVAHGEGRFELQDPENQYQIPLKYAYQEYPGNPNNSDYATAALVSTDGRHLAMMPHLERSFRPYHWPYYPRDRREDEVTPWIEAFVNAREWIKLNK